jgi:hypothetical protein
MFERQLERARYVNSPAMTCTQQATAGKITNSQRVIDAPEPALGCAFRSRCHGDARVKLRAGMR